jgi:ATP-dependent Clp protease ATP-binding subunit ClpA
VPTGATPPDLQGFAADARHAVHLAIDEARALGHDRVGTEHLLLGLLASRDTSAALVLDEAGAGLPSARRKVTEAVGTGGAGDGAPTWSPRATRALGRAPRFARDDRAPTVGSEHLLLAVLDVEGTAGQVLRGLSVDLEQLRAALAGGRDGAPDQPAAVPPAHTVALTCPGCHGPLDTGVLGTEVPVLGAESQPVTVLSCPSCGTVLGVSPR